MEVTMHSLVNKLAFGAILLVLFGSLTVQFVSAEEAKAVFGVA
jgi:hypothetical protein